MAHQLRINGFPVRSVSTDQSIYIFSEDINNAFRFNETLDRHRESVAVQFTIMGDDHSVHDLSEDEQSYIAKALKEASWCPHTPVVGIAKLTEMVMNLHLDGVPLFGFSMSW